MTQTDNYFGPQLPGVFDFTILFEQSILSLLPACIFIVLAPLRISTLVHRETVVLSRKLFWSKQVRTYSRQLQLVLTVAGCCCRILLSSNYPRSAMGSTIHTQDKDVPCRSRSWHP